MVFIIAPTAFMFTASAMPAKDILAMPYKWIPETFYWQNYVKALEGNRGNYIFLRNILNSLIVASVVTITTVFLSLMTGYGLVKFRFRGRKLIFIAMMITMMIPFETIMIPLYLVVTRLNLQNSYAGLTIPFLVNAFGIFLMRQYLIPFPDEFLDSARIDGAGEIRILFRIVLPNCIPAIATLAIITFRSQWDNLIWPLLIAQSDEMKTIPLYIVKFAAEKYSDEGALLAVACIASLPIFLMFFLLSKYFVKGASLFASRKG
jgi:multiple sugar transport system permease protein